MVLGELVLKSIVNQALSRCCVIIIMLRYGPSWRDLGSSNLLQTRSNPLPNLKYFLLKYPKYLFTIKPNFEKEYLDPILEFI
jgi:hypothetical protein